MNALVMFLGLSSAAAFVPPTTVQQLRVAVPSTASPVMFVGGGSSAPKKTSPAKGKASPSKPVVSNKAKPLSPGSNYPSTKNIQTQRSGFGTFLQKFQTTKGKSKYGMPIFLPNGNVNPAYLAAERAEMRATSKKNTKTAEAKRKALIAGKQFELADYVRKKIGAVGSGKDYYQSGR